MAEIVSKITTFLRAKVIPEKKRSRSNSKIIILGNVFRGIKANRNGEAKQIVNCYTCWLGHIARMQTTIGVRNVLIGERTNRRQPKNRRLMAAKKDLRRIKVEDQQRDALDKNNLQSSSGPLGLSS